MTTNDTNVTGFPIANVLSGVVHGTAAASKAVILDASSKIDAMDITALSIGGVAQRAQGAASETVLVAGAVSITTRETILSGASGAYAVTLAAPAAGSAGQVKCIRYLTGSTNAITMALTNCTGGSAATTASFNAAGEALTLISSGLVWQIVSEGGGVTLS